MASDLLRPKSPLRPRLGHPSRLTDGAVEVSLLMLGHAVVFFVTLFHDEIIAELVEEGWLLARLAERYEIVLGMALFLCWSALLLRLVAVLRRISEERAGR
ncbi:MAG: hypothetical protein EP307_05250 [Rhodobacteraceae bacterium]|nr:MAG: hypothetical protein EP307_05250 [Paracoccaceae bacterium]